MSNRLIHHFLSFLWRRKYPASERLAQTEHRGKSLHTEPVSILICKYVSIAICYTSLNNTIIIYSFCLNNANVRNSDMVVETHFDCVWKKLKGCDGIFDVRRTNET